jgi:molybdenum cofactor cytidylyltransferase
MELRVSAVLLAAGSSKRMGQPKLLLPLGDKPVIKHCIDTLSAAGIGDIVAVVSMSGNGIREVLRDSPAVLAMNRIPGSDMAESVRTGLRELKGSPSGVLVCLSDHPLVSSATIKSITQQHQKTPDSILIPSYQGKRGHPTLFPNAIISGLLSGSNRTLRDIIRDNTHRVRTIDVNDEGVVLDMDTEEDYHEILQKAGARKEGL